MNRKIYYFIYLLLQAIIIGVFCISLAFLSEIIIILWQKGLLFKISFNDFIKAIYLSLKNILVGGILAGLGGWVMFLFNYHRSTKFGIQALKTLRKNGYKVKINEISPNPKIPLYKINGELFYNFAPSTASRGFILSELKNVIKRADPKNIVINLTGSPKININKLKSKISKKFGNKLNKVIVINKGGNVGDLSQDTTLYPCPCCDNFVFHKEGKGETCPICGWIDDPIQSLDPDYKNGWNKISLNEAKTLFNQQKSK